MQAGTEETAVARTAGLWLGAVFVLIGLGVGTGMVLDPKGLTVPLWLGLAVAATFSAAGLSVILRALGYSGVAQLFGVVCAFGLALPGLWFLVEPAGGSCTRSFLFWTSTTGGAECRLVFGVGGIVTLLIAVAFAVTLFRRVIRSN